MATAYANANFEKWDEAYDGRFQLSEKGAWKLREVRPLTLAGVAVLARALAALEGAKEHESYAGDMLGACRLILMTMRKRKSQRYRLFQRDAQLLGRVEPDVGGPLNVRRTAELSEVGKFK